jgi:hypothetical protein
VAEGAEAAGGTSVAEGEEGVGRGSRRAAVASRGVSRCLAHDLACASCAGFGTKLSPEERMI